jgi:septum formation protein
MTHLETRIYLASKSPRRRELLAQIGVRFDLMLFRSGAREDPETNEDALPGELPDAYVMRVAVAKATHGARMIGVRRIAPRPVLAADTTLDIDGEIVGKPYDERHAEDILSRLSGRSHRVLTTVAVAHGDRVLHRTSISEVRFRTLDPGEIHRYVLTGEPMDKAGAYGIQGRAGGFVEEIRGSFSGIVGLPLCETTLLLREFGCQV